MKLFRRWSKGKEMRELQLRIDHCRSTIAEVHRALGVGEVEPEIAAQFRRLEAALEQIDVKRLTDRDIERIEKATNKLLDEFRGLYREGRLKNIHNGPLH